MAGTVTTTEERLGSVQKISFDWASSAGGAADATTTGYYNGMVERAVFVPDSGGTQPTDSYDVVVNDDDSIDVCRGFGANLSNATSLDVHDLSTPVANCQLTLAVTNAGNAKGGLVVLYLR